MFLRLAPIFVVLALLATSAPERAVAATKSAELKRLTVKRTTACRKAPKGKLCRKLSVRVRRATTGRTLYVAPNGSDAATGSAGAPLATLTAALAQAAGGERIVVAAGSYPRATDTRERSATVTVTGPGAALAKVAGMKIEGGQELAISGLGFTAQVSVRYHATRMKAQPARDIAFSAADFTAPAGSGCIEARNAVSGLSITDSVIHDCVTGFGAGAGGAIPQSRGLLLSGNRFERFTGDAIQFGQWDDVRITRNVITGMRDPAGVIHNDGIQLTGNVRGVMIAMNRITDSRTQLIFIQDAVGPIDDVTVKNNLIAGAGAVAVQSQGATNARFLNNTIWKAKDGGLWLRQGSSRPGVARSVPTDTVVLDNIISGFKLLEGAAPIEAAGNAGYCASWETPAAGFACLPDVGFVSGDYRLRPDAAARPLASGAAGVATDIDGALRPAPAPGAFA